MTPERRDELARLFARWMGAEAASPDDATLVLLDRALTHRSYATEHPTLVDGDYESLEFLGDAAVGLGAAAFLMQRDPGAREGVLSRRRAALVSRERMGAVALGMGLGDLLLLGQGEIATGGRERPSTLGSALEAVVGALFLSVGWSKLEPALRRLVYEPGLALAADAPEDASDGEAKSRLQEWAAREGLPKPEYALLDTTGPEHARVYRVAVRVGDRALGEGTGARKRTAQAAAALDALARLAAAKG